MDVCVWSMVAGTGAVGEGVHVWRVFGNWGMGSVASLASSSQHTHSHNP